MNGEQKTYTKKELIEKCLQHDPSLKDHADLEQIALGGYVELKNGLFIEYGLYKLMKNIQYQTTSGGSNDT